MKKILIITAMEVEQRYFLPILKNPKQTSLLNQSLLTEGEYQNYHIGVILSGIGKVNAGISTMLGIAQIKPDLIINIGVAGGLLAQQKTGDIVIGTNVAYHDVDVRTFGYQLGQVPNLPVYFSSELSLSEKILAIGQNKNFPISLGGIISGDQFISNNLVLEGLIKNFADYKAVEMEAASIAHTAYLTRIPFVIIRSISDKADDNAQINYNDFLEQAAQRASDLIIEFLNSSSY